MTYAALTNWKYDKSLYHPIQSGPQHTGNDLNLTDTYAVVGSGYVDPQGNVVQWYGVDNQGTDFGRYVPGPPNAAVSGVFNPAPVVYDVQIYNPGTGNKFYIDLVESPPLRIQQRGTYVFDQSHPTNTGNRLAFSTTPDGTFGGGVIYTEGVTQTGTPGTTGANTTIVVSTTSPTTLYYFSEDDDDYGDEIDVQPGAISNMWTYSTDWRYVPTAVPGYWYNYNEMVPDASGVLTVRDGYRRQGLFHTANSTVQNAYGPEPGLKSIGAYTYFNGFVPVNQDYSPFATPAQNSTAEGRTGGAETYPRGQYPMLINPTNNFSGSRQPWVYCPPVYCQTFVESRRSTFPGTTATIARDMYRGRSSYYVPNYASVYGVLGEGVRGMIHTFSASVNSSNQKGI